MAVEEKLKDEKNIDSALQEAKKIIAQIKYGSVTLVVQDGTVVQIERQEKLRLK
ncbi:MAG: YezD family protein [Treponema sp.]|nr:YezD family protein [Treponema sp.]